MENIEMLINDLENAVLTAKHAAFNNSDIVINRAMLLDIISRVRASYPQVMKESAAIVKERDDILSKAESYANEAMDKAEEHARYLISESEVLKRAKESADSINAEAEENFNRMDYESRLHAYKLLESVQTSLQDALSTISESMNNIKNN